MKLVIAWLYPNLMNTYGDRGNIICLKKRCEWRNIQTEIKELNIGFDKKLLDQADILFMGGAQDKQQRIVEKDLRNKRNNLVEILKNNTPGLFICGAYQLFGNYYKDSSGLTIKGLEILNIHTESNRHKRMIGNILIKTDFNSGNKMIIGFENHGGETYLEKNVKPFGKVIKGYGNNGVDKYEGVLYNNWIFTYMHGPLLPKNPEIADFLIKCALEKKYNTNILLSKLDEELEKKARETIARKLNIRL